MRYSSIIMRAVIQRTSEAKVIIGTETVGQISKGLLVYLGAHKQDSEQDVQWMSNKVSSLRVFPDPDGKMSYSLLDIQGAILVISQFTLFGDVRKGRRPSFDGAAPPVLAEKLYAQFCEQCRSLGLQVQTGRFRKKMQVYSQIDGPVTILVDSHRKF